MDLEQQLHAALAPCKPGPALRANVIARLSAGERPARAQRRASSPLVLAGAVLAVAAAASVLVASLTRSPALPVVSLATAPVPVPEPAAPLAVSVPTPAVVESTPGPVPVQAEPGGVISRTRLLTVSVGLLHTESTEAAVGNAVETFHRTLLDGLRATPGLELIEQGSDDALAAVPIDFRLTLKGTGSAQANAFTIDLRANRVGRVVQPYQLSGNLECSGGGNCGDPATMANTMLKLLRETMLPEKSTQLREMRARLLDPVLDARARLDALRALETLRDDGAVPVVGRSARGLSALREPAVVRGAIELAAVASEEFVRAQVWKKMRGVGNAELVQPLIAAATMDSSSNVRVEAVMTLAADFSGDPRVRAALETVSRQDSRPVARVLAQSGLSGKAAWPRHVVASLQDTSLSDLDRIEAIYYAMNQSQTRSADLRDVLVDDESIRAFVQVLPRAVASATSREDRATASELVTVLLTRLGSIDHPAITDMLLDAWEHPVWADPFLVLTQLGRRGADPRVRALLEKISGESADSPLRGIARDALNKLAAPPAR